MDRNIIVPTKLLPPPVPEEWIDRPRLLQHLNAGFNAARPLTLVSAPAGFGKSTCLSRWIEYLEDVSASWLSLDSSDNDPGCFFSYLLTALQTVHDSIGRDLRGILEAGELPSAERIAAALIGDMITLASPFVIVLDDLHFIQDIMIYKSLEILIKTPPPHLRLVFSTREDPPLPIARLRANGRLTEIRGSDLRFDGGETRRFIKTSMKLPLTENDILNLEAKTEGWAAGLKLAALALHSLPMSPKKQNLSEFISSLNGRHHYIAKYLTEQVLSRLSSEFRDFLLQTSILDELNAEVCNAVTGRSDSALILERLSAENLFISTLDDQGRRYRYHHLFTDLLREQGRIFLTIPIEELHRRACSWYREAGIPEAAIKHSLAAEDFSTAAELLENHAMDIIMRGHVKTLNIWIDMLPREHIHHNPGINLAFAWMYVLRGNTASAKPFMDRLQSIFNGTDEEECHSSGDTTLKSEWLVLRSLVAYREGKLEDVLDLAGKALNIASFENHRVLSMAYYSQASAYNALGKLRESEKSFKAALQSSVFAPNQIAELLSTAGLCVSTFERGRLYQSEEIILPVLERLQQSDSQPSMSCVIYGSLAEIYYMWNRREEARQFMLKSLRLSTLGGYTGQTGSRIFLSKLELLEGDLQFIWRRMKVRAVFSKAVWIWLTSL